MPDKRAMGRTFRALLRAIISFSEGKNVIYVCRTEIHRDSIFNNAGITIDSSGMNANYDWPNRKISYHGAFIRILTQSQLAHKIERHDFRGYDNLEIHIDHSIYYEPYVSALLESGENPRVKLIGGSE